MLYLLGIDTIERKRRTLNKIYTSAAALLMAMSVGATAALAASTPLVAVTNDKNASVAYTYDAASQVEEKTAAEKLFSRFTDANSTDFTKSKMTITSVSSNNTPVEIYLKLEAEPVSDEYSVLNYYTFRISDTNGNLLYDADYFADPDATEKIIPFGTFNEQYTKDVKSFDVEYMIRDSMSHTPTKEELDKLKVYVASKPIEKQVPSAVSDTANAMNEVEAVAEDVPVDAASDETAAPTVTAAPAAAATPVPQTITKVCGKDITPGRYVVSGNGTVLIRSKAGETKSEQVVTDGKTEGVKGVEQYVVTLSDGDEINMTALPGQEKPSIKFEKTNDTAKTASASSSTAARTAAAKNAATAKSASAKTNPKTGEGGVPVAALTLVMLAAAAAIGGLEVVKRRHVSK